jgi:glycosyltransferase involved in cell wall biosynthesis
VTGGHLRICAVRQFPFDTHLRREVDVLLDAGHEVDVVCMSRPGEPRRERRGSLTIWRMPVGHRRAGAQRYVIEHVAFLATAMLTVAALHVRRRFAVVQVNSPPDSVVLAALVPKLAGTPVLLDLVECTPEFFATRFGTGQGHPVVRLLSAVEQLALRFADGAITGTRQMRERFAERGADPGRIDVVLNSSDERFFRLPDQADSAASRDGAFTLICHGSIERRYGLDTIIRAVALLAHELPDLRFEIYGEGSGTDELRQLAAELGVAQRVGFNGFVEIGVLVEAIAAADAGIVAVKRDPFRDLTHTNKMFDFVALRRPAIISWTQSVADYFDDSAVEYFRSDDPEDLARAIRRLHSEPERRAAMVRRASELYDDYRWPRQAQIYLSAVERLARRRRARVVAGQPDRP